MLFITACSLVLAKVTGTIISIRTETGTGGEKIRLNGHQRAIPSPTARSLYKYIRPYKASLPPHGQGYCRAGIKSCILVEVFIGLGAGN